VTATATQLKYALLSADLVPQFMADEKTNTRRLMKPQPEYFERYPHWRWTTPQLRKDGLGPFAIDSGDRPGIFGKYVPGDHIAFLSTWAAAAKYDHLKPLDIPKQARVWTVFDDGPNRDVYPPHWIGKRRPGRFMPLWMRKRLPNAEITDVRVERLQEISDEDIIAEGVRYPINAVTRTPLIRVSGKCPPVAYHRPIDVPAGETLTHSELLRCHFASLWDTINGEGSWESNPWVWVISFRRNSKGAADA
jgi:hypothetical protein